jgi:alpha-glucosidase
MPWWNSAVFYQIYPRSFCDANGDGIGDLPGVRLHLDYLEWLGINGIWLSPFYPSPMKDGGYDISDYCNVDPIFGTLADFDCLLSEAHERGIKVILDWVPNHTSDRHPWFVESRASRTNPRRNWYIWRDPHLDGSPPNNWIPAFADSTPLGEDRYSAWKFDEGTGQSYLHLFLPEQPDLNWRCPDMSEAMYGVLRFWLDRGVDGFRGDAIHCLMKDLAFGDDPPELAQVPKSSTNDHPDTHEIIRRVRSLLDSYPGDRMIVGEVFPTVESHTANVGSFYGKNDELHLAFNFRPLHTPWQAESWRKCITEVSAHLDPIRAWPTWVISNHDNPRHKTRYGGSEARARAAAVLLLTARGTPFLFAGEELGLEDAEIPVSRMIDPGGRDGSRAPIPWDGSSSHGWRSTEPWLPWPPEANRLNVAGQRADPNSILWLYRNLLSLRQQTGALTRGDMQLRDSPKGILVYDRMLGSECRRVIINFGHDKVFVPVDGDWTIELASDELNTQQLYNNWVASDQAVILRPL